MLYCSFGAYHRISCPQVSRFVLLGFREIPFAGPVAPRISTNAVLSLTGPNSITFEYSKWVPHNGSCTRSLITPSIAGVVPDVSISRIWRSFMPLSSYGVFQRGGYFIVDVIPDTLAVISLNTIYFYDSNAGARCLLPSHLFHIILSHGRLTPHFC